MSTKLNQEQEDEILEFVDEEDSDLLELSTFKMGVRAPVEAKPPVVINIEEMTPESFTQDFNIIRANLKSILSMGTSSLQRMIMVAEESEHPRAFEVVATLLKTLADINKDLLAVHEKKKEVENMRGPNNEPPAGSTNTQNNIFVGTTAELAKLLKGKSTKDVQSDEEY